MSWIDEIPYSEAQGALKKLYNRVKGPNDYIDNILSVHSLRPHSLLGHISLYKNVLHHRNNTLPKWYLETLGIYVSMLNRCAYCIDHHSAGLKRLLDDEDRYKQIMEGLRKGEMSKVFGEKYAAGITYSQNLTQAPYSLKASDIQHLRELGFTDGEMLEINQVVSYFNYANRSVLGLGVTTEGDILGLSPNNSDDAANWSHQ